MQDTLQKNAEKFKFEGEILSIKPILEGHVNDTFLIATHKNKKYILQKKNKKIFQDVPAMMDNIINVTGHLKRKIQQQGGNPDRETINIIFTDNNLPYFIDPLQAYWTMMLCIENCITFEKAETEQITFQGGLGTGKFQSMLADFQAPLKDILPGFHNIKFKFEQWEQSIKEDKLNRKKELLKEISWIEDRKDEILDFWTLVETKKIPTRVTHNDTKISNFLFDKKTQQVLCAIDLDTVQNSICLNDFGDAIRSYTNTGLEDDKNLHNVSMSINMFKAYTRGYIKEAKVFLTPIEIEYLAFSAKYIVYEQVLRFLMDYLNGDTYYKINYPNHNLIRTHAQYKLLQSIELQLPQMQEFVKSYV
ncbi:MAG: phosphotransferase [Chitinophagaceae bacterium]